MAGRAKKSDLIARPAIPPDEDETAGLNAAAAALKELLPSTSQPEAVASAVISAWITERMSRLTGARAADLVVFDHTDAKLRGMVSGVLPQIGASVAAAGLPADVPFFQLTKAQAVDLFTIGCVAYREAAIRAGEWPDFPFNDPIPFGVEIRDTPPF